MPPIPPFGFANIPAGARASTTLAHRYAVRVASSTRQFVQNHFPNAHIPPHFFTTPVGDFMQWLTLHTHVAYGALFLGAYFETLIGTGFFIPGEIFFLAGSILAGIGILDIWLVLPALYIGAILGDSSSYFIGRLLGESVFKEERAILSKKNYRKIEKLLEKFGPQAIFLARLVGPFSKIAPALAGVFEIPFPTFLLYNIPGVLIGVGEFIAVGYFFGYRYEFVLLILERYLVLFFVLLVLAIILYIYFKRRHAAHKKHRATHADHTATHTNYHDTPKK